MSFTFFCMGDIFNLLQPSIIEKFHRLKSKHITYISCYLNNLRWLWWRTWASWRPACSWSAPRSPTTSTPTAARWGTWQKQTHHTWKHLNYFPPFLFRERVDLWNGRCGRLQGKLDADVSAHNVGNPERHNVAHRRERARAGAREQGRAHHGAPLLPSHLCIQVRRSTHTIAFFIYWNVWWKKGVRLIFY